MWRIVEDKSDKENKLAIYIEKVFDRLIDELSNLREKAINSLPFVISP